MAKNKDKGENFLDFVPVRNEKYDYETDENGNVSILKVNTGIMNRIFQKIFHKPAVSYIHLDKMGNFIWPLLDGTRTVMDLSLEVKEEFGDEAEPLYDRLIKYLKILESYGFIIIKEKGDIPNEET